jgi:hypothetical protein
LEPVVLPQVTMPQITVVLLLQQRVVGVADQVAASVTLAAQAVLEIMVGLPAAQVAQVVTRSVRMETHSADRLEHHMER